MKIALASLDISWEDKEGNSKKCQTLAQKVREHNVDLIIFPEMTLTGFSMKTNLTAEEEISSPSIQFFNDLATTNSLSIIAGVVIRNSNKAFNRLIAFSSDGQIRSDYNKIHPFSFAGENRFFDGGREIAKIQLGEINFGLSICYDLRFPELYSALAKDCEVLVNIANWPKKRVEHWKALLKARAIENQVYMIGVNRTGTDGNGLEYEKSSFIINANGEIIPPLSAFDEIDIYEIKKENLYEFRNHFSTRQDRLPEFYKGIIG